MKAEFTCDICNAPMELEKKLLNHKKGNKEYRRRRFKCSVCDFQKTIFAGGEGDEKLFPERGISEIKSKFRQEEINRLGRPNKIR